MASDEYDCASSVEHDDDADAIAATQEHDAYIKSEDRTLAILTLIEPDGGHSSGGAMIKSMHIERLEKIIDMGYVLVARCCCLRRTGLMAAHCLDLSHKSRIHMLNIYNSWTPNDLRAPHSLLKECMQSSGTSHHPTA